MKRLSAVPAVAGALILCAVILSTPGWTMRTEYNIESLRGLGGVHVIIQSLDEDVVRDGLSQDALQAAVEQRLESAGVRTLKEDELVSARGGILFIALDSLGSETGLYACNIRAELIQVAMLARDQRMIVPATTWMTGLVTVVDRARVPGLQLMTLKVIDEFAKDFHTANLPQGQGSEIAAKPQQGTGVRPR